MAISSSFPTAKPLRIVIAGDWHGRTEHALEVVKWARARGAEGILQLGDFGIWAGAAGEAYLRDVTAALNRADMWLVFIDGNHENFDLLESLPLQAGVRPVTQWITHLPRGYRWTWGERTWLALGGAVSMDLAWRRPRVDWWPQEEITWGQAHSAMTSGTADFMLTHDAPLSARTPGLSDGWPEDALKSAAAHRALLDVVVEDVRPSRLWHGHMHVRYSDSVEYRGWDQPCLVEGLASDREPFMHGVLLIDLDARGQLLRMVG